MFNTWCSSMFYLFLREIDVYKHFHFSIWLSKWKMAAKGYVTIFCILLVNNSAIY